MYQKDNMKTKMLICILFLGLFCLCSCKKEPDKPGTIIPQVWKTYNKSNGLLNNCVSDIAIDAAGEKWFAVSAYSSDGEGSGGLSHFDGTNWTTYSTSNSGLVYDHVTTVEIDHEGNKWIGYGQATIGSGVSKFDGTAWTNYTSSGSGLVSDQVTAIAIDSVGNKWFGTSHGLSKFDGTNWTSYNSSNGLGSDFIIAITVDYENNVWVGTWDGGIAKFDGTDWVVYNRSNSGMGMLGSIKRTTRCSALVAGASK